MNDPLKLIMAPMNFADQPMALVRALRSRGVDAHHLQYTASGEHALGYELDRIVRLRTADHDAQLGILADLIAEGFNLYHFWQRSLLFGPSLDGLTGFDLPIIKAHGGVVFHRFTGFDLRMPTLDKAANRFSPFHYGYHSPFNEARQRAYIDMLREHVDLFFVQDPELHQFMPEARILPRGLQLEQWPMVGVGEAERPLVVHAPSNAAVKGSRFIVRALEELIEEGLRFEFKLLDRVPHAEAREWYKRADIIVDQILIGATGVLTLEAWALGKPCVTYLREDLFGPFYGTRDLPVANATPETIKNVLRELIKDGEWRRALSSGGRALAERHHDIAKISLDYEAMCREALEQSRGFNASNDDVLYFRSQVRAILPEPDPLNLPAVDWSTRRGLPAPRRQNPATLTHAGRVEMRIHNALSRTLGALLTVQERFTRALGLSEDLQETLWLAQMRASRGLFVALTRVIGWISRLRRRWRHMREA